jgi:hypothetical protein
MVTIPDRDHLSTVKDERFKNAVRARADVVCLYDVRWEA